MASSIILAHLKNQFSGQLVLYVDDIAKVLGKSDKAISNLIARDALPFKVKTVGGLRCINTPQCCTALLSQSESWRHAEDNCEVGQETVLKPGASMTNSSELKSKYENC